MNPRYSLHLQRSLRFAVFALCLAIYSTHSLAGHAPARSRFLLMSLTETLVAGLILNLSLQHAFGLSFYPQNTRVNLHKDQTQSNDLCQPNVAGILSLGQNNFTQCLEQYQYGNFSLVDNIDFHLFSQMEKDKYPLYNDTTPFSGVLHMAPYHLKNFQITRSSTAAMFDVLHNARINANFTHANVVGNRAALVAGKLSGHNIIECEHDTVSLKAELNGFETVHNLHKKNRGIIRPAYTGTVAAHALSKSTGHITLNIKNRCTLTSEKYAGGALGLVEHSSDFKIDMSVNMMTLTCGLTSHTGTSCGGVVGYTNLANFTINLTGSSITILNIHDHTHSSGGVFGHTSLDNQKLTINAQVDHFTISRGTSLKIASAAIIGTTNARQSNTNQQVLFIRGMHVDIQGHPSAVGIAQALSLQNSPRIYLLAISGKLGAFSHIIAAQGSCKKAIVDWSGINLDTKNLGCTEAQEFNTTVPNDWRQAHALVAEEICKSNATDCFYIYEDGIALAKDDRHHRVFLMSQQRYPYHPENDGQGIVRLTQFTLNASPQYPALNTSFALNGARLFTHTDVRLPNGYPVSVSVTNDSFLALYQLPSAQLITMSLEGEGDTVYTVDHLNNAATYIQLDSNILWSYQDGMIFMQNLPNSSTTPFVAFPNAPLGIRHYAPYTYVAAFQNHQILVTRFNDAQQQDFNWNTTLDSADYYRYRYLHLEGHRNDPNASFPLINEIVISQAPEGLPLTIDIPAEGGYGLWRYGPAALKRNIPPQTPTYPESNNTNNSARIIGPMMAIGNMIVITMVASIVCFQWIKHKKEKRPNAKYFH